MDHHKDIDHRNIDEYGLEKKVHVSYYGRNIRSIKEPCKLRIQMGSKLKMYHKKIGLRKVIWPISMSNSLRLFVVSIPLKLIPKVLGEYCNGEADLILLP